jgi:uncharacterized membrane-anchored protein YitT (DUF2179 family)
MKEAVRLLLLKERTSAYAQIILGSFIGGLAYPLFLVPNGIAPGGLTGVSTVLNYLLAFPVGMTSLAMNIPLFIISFRSVGRVFAVRSLIATVLFSLAIDLINVKPLTDDTLLGALYGGILLGAGLGLILRGNATTGGTDMIAKIIHKRFSFISVPMILFLLDCVVIIGAGVFIDAVHALYALICIYVSTKVMDAVLTGIASVKACYVITGREQPITARLMDELGRGVTHLMARGGYTGAERPVILCVVNSQELTRLKEIVRQEDERAFLFITGAHEALGEGFSSLTEKP